jgi:hypothetical protein
MAFTRLPTATSDDDLFEPQPPITTERLNGKFSLPSVKLGAILIAQLAVGIILLFIGISASGSYFGTDANRFKGFLATLFYSYQLGTILIIAGTIFIYDVFRSIRKP